ncbi:uncharacterized protein si:ch211-80h18.1 [Antennarius striatus]|uniref:uncharacterized protein si:ch211-80h18.1 n=1 Tax=Antennarius striatus TaxID=241820 RepID=UPI0035AFBDEE
MGGGDPFGLGADVNNPGFLTPPTQLDPTAIRSRETAAQFGDQNAGIGLDTPADPPHHAHVGTDQSGHSAPSSGPQASLSGPAPHASHPEVQGGGSDLSDSNGNRLTLLTDANAVTDRLVSSSDFQTDLTAGGAESVTRLHIDLTASSLDVTASGGYAHTDLVTMAAGFTVADTVSADPTGAPLDSSRPAATGHTQAAGSVTEQYDPSGPGPEGAKNVELEDTC